KAKDAPADHQMPSRAQVTTTDPRNPARTKVSQTSSAFDEMGRQKRLVQGGVETTTQYGPHSIPVRTETKDTATGARQVVENTLTGDGKAIAKTVTKAAEDGTGEPQTVSTSAFDYHGGELAGEVAKTTVTGDPSAKGGDPGAAVSSTESQVERDGEGVGRRTDAVTGADGVTTTTVTDLASGATLSEKTGDLAESTTTYDIADRPIAATGTDGTVTTFSYGRWSGGASTTSTRKSDGFASKSVSDELGRDTATHSNYRPSANSGQGGMLPEGQWLETSAAEYDRFGRRSGTVDAGGRRTTIEYDAWGKPARTTGRDGTVVLSGYDDVAGTTTSRTVPSGSDRPTVTATETLDDQGRPVTSETAFGDGTPGSVAESTHDAFGKLRRSDSDTSPFIAEHSYTPSGLPRSDTLTPKTTGGGAGDAAQADYTFDAFGNKTLKRLSENGQSAEGWGYGFDAAGRTKDVSLPGGGGTTTTTYDRTRGLVESVALPDGSVAHQRADRAGRVTESWVSPKAAPGERHEHVRMSYDPVTGKRAAVWFADAESSSKITFTYHPDGTLKEQADPGGKKTAYTYTDDGRPATVTDHTGAVTSYTYDQKTGRMRTAVQTRDGKTLAEVSYTFGPEGRLTGIDRGNGAASAYTFNDAGLPTGEKHTAPGGRVIAEHAYTYTARHKLATGITVIDGQKTATAYSYDTE
ncbi:RHS repeat protein, partial [Streptomyces sp. ADI96-02]|uniref:RHS repeat protein n=1 Tax=Streptomyces sp. ADI96-02 TaxID=1522760 RepID=UPI0013DDB129